MYPSDYYAGAHKKLTHDYTGLSGVDEYLNAADWNEGMGSVSYGTGRTGHIVAIERTLGLNPHGSFATVAARLDALRQSSINFYIHGIINNGSQSISGVSFGSDTIKLIGMEANVAACPEGDIGGHFDIYDNIDATGAKLLSLHLNSGDLWGSCTGASWLAASKPIYIYSVTASTMGYANLTVHYQF